MVVPFGRFGREAERLTGTGPKRNDCDWPASGTFDERRLTARAARCSIHQLRSRLNAKYLIPRGDHKRPYVDESYLHLSKADPLESSGMGSSEMSHIDMGMSASLGG